MTKKAIETLEFRGLVTLLFLVGALILFFSIHHRHRSLDDDDAKPPPTVPAGSKAPLDRF